MKQIKVIVINSEKQTVEEKTITPGIESLYNEIGCRCVSAFAMNNRTTDCMYIDDEGMMNEDIKGGFELDNYMHPIAGNGVIVGDNGEGDDDDCKTTLESVKSQIKWTPASQMKGVADAILNAGPIFFSNID